MDRIEALAIVHRRFADTEPELSNGFAEHAPMGAEAMLTLGLDPSAVLDWSRRHVPVPLPARSPLRSVRDSIAAELHDGPWRHVLTQHGGRLVSRLDAHLFHGLIRVAHAVRALERRDGPDARGELALGLAAWTTWAPNEHVHVTPSSVADPLGEILELARLGAVAFVHSPSIVTLHAVTAPMAYMLVAEYLDPADHSGAAGVFRRTHAHLRHSPRRAGSRPAPDNEQLVELLSHWDAHPAKLFEAAQRGFAETGDAAFGEVMAAVLRPPTTR